MMRLMIEEVSKHDSKRRSESLARGAEIIERPIEARGVEAVDHADQPIVLRDPRDLKCREIAIEDLVQRKLLGPTLDAAKPNPVRNHEVIECRVDRAEEARPGFQVLALGKLGAGAIEPRIRPGIIAREGAVIGIAHRVLPKILWSTVYAR